MLFPIYLILHDAIIGGSHVILAYEILIKSIMLMLMHILKFNFFYILNVTKDSLHCDAMITRDQ